MAYLCVDPDGVELICRDKPIRWADVRIPICRDKPIRWADVRIPTEERAGSYLDMATGTRYYVRTALSLSDIGAYKVHRWYWVCEELTAALDRIDTSIPLPAGSIERLIGRNLTWDDEPVELI